MRPTGCARSPSSRHCTGSGAASMASCHSGVKMLPGEMALTRTPWTASSIASALVNDSTAPFVATYVVAWRWPSVATRLAMFAMLPCDWRSQGSAPLHATYRLIRLSSRMARKSSTLKSSIGR